MDSDIITKEQWRNLLTLAIVALIAFGFLLWIWKYTPMYKNLWAARQAEAEAQIALTSKDSPLSGFTPMTLDEIQALEPQTAWEGFEKFIFENVAGVRWQRNR